MSAWTPEREAALVEALLDERYEPILGEVAALLDEVRRLRAESALAAWFVALEPGDEVALRWARGVRIVPVVKVGGPDVAYQRWVFVENDWYRFDGARCVDDKHCDTTIGPVTPEVRREVRAAEWAAREGA